jgi:hypothetical protein
MADKRVMKQTVKAKRVQHEGVTLVGIYEVELEGQKYTVQSEDFGFGTEWLLLRGGWDEQADGADRWMNTFPTKRDAIQALADGVRWEE